MPINVTWENNQHTAIYFECVRPWKWDEFDTGIDQIHAMMGSVSHTVHVIFDVTNIGSIPDNAFHRFQYAARNRHPNTGQITFVGASPFLRWMAEAVATMVQRFSKYPAVHFVATREQARTAMDVEYQVEHRA